MAQPSSAAVGAQLAPAASLFPFNPFNDAGSSVVKREACPGNSTTGPTAASSAAESEAHLDKLARLLKPRPLATKTTSKQVTSKPASSSGSYARVAYEKAVSKTATGSKRARDIGTSNSLARTPSMQAAARTLMSIKKGLGLSTKRKTAIAKAPGQNSNKSAVKRVHPPPVARVHPPPVTRVHPPPVKRVHPPPVGTPPMVALGGVASSRPTSIKTPPSSASPIVAAAAAVLEQPIFNTMQHKAANAMVSLWEDGVEAILDIGSSVTILAQSLVANMGWEHLVRPVNNISMTMANGGSSALLGSIRVPITLAGMTMEVTAYVTAAAPYKMLLGMDWLAPTGSVIDLGRQVVTIVPKQCSAPLF